MTLLAFLRKHKKKETSVKSLKKLIDEKSCYVNAEIERFATRALKKGDAVALKEAQEKATLKILFEDDFLLLCDKPSGMISDSESIHKALKNVSYVLVHRLDRETSGVLIVAKSQKVYEAMVELFSEKKVEKTYLAVVKGCVKKEEGAIDRPIGLKKRMQGISLYEVSKSGKPALTHFRSLKTCDQYSLLLCHPITGRTHQIRVHLQSIGHPILGDSLYGKTENYPRLLLHAYQIAFKHPITHEKISIKAPLPPIFKKFK